MARIFYTERDIENLARQGIREIEENDNVYLTDLARERMEVLGIKSRRSGKSPDASASPAPASQPAAASPSAAGASGTLSASEKQQVIDKVKAGVITRLGPGVDTAMVDTIVRRVVGQL